MLEPGCDGHMKILDKHRPSSWFQWLFFAWASMADYGLDDVIEGFGPFGTPCCKFHTQIGLWPSGWLVIKQWLQHLGLHMDFNTKWYIKFFFKYNSCGFNFFIDKRKKNLIINVSPFNNIYAWVCMFMRSGEKVILCTKKWNQFK